MKSDTQSEKIQVKSSTSSGAFSLSEAKSQLKTLGDQIEAIAKRLEKQGSRVDSEGLYEVGNKVEHFLDNMDAEKLIGKISEPSEKSGAWKGKRH